MKTDPVGNPIFEFQDLIELMHSDEFQLAGVECEPSDEVERFNQQLLVRDRPIIHVRGIRSVDPECVDQQNQNTWFIPAKYADMDLTSWLLDQCTTNDQLERVGHELVAYQKRNMITILKCMKFLVDYMRENDIVYGVGRGSSVASYVLYLIGIHRINSLKYGLEFEEFMRD